MTAINEIKLIIETAKRILSNGSWTPSNGGEYICEQTGTIVTFSAKTNLHLPSFRVISDFLGVWGGNMNGPKGSKIGKPFMIYTADQVRIMKENSKK